MEPMLRWQQAGQRREDGPVWPTAAWPAALAAQDRDLVAQDEDLGVLGCLFSGQQSKPADELVEDQVEESERHGRRSSRFATAQVKLQVNAMDQVFGTYTSNGVLAAFIHPPLGSLLTWPAGGNDRR